MRNPHTYIYVAPGFRFFTTPMKFFSGSTLFSSKKRTSTSPPQPHEIAEALSKRIHQANAQIAVFRDNTGALDGSITGTLYDLLLQNHHRLLHQLRHKYGHNISECNIGYQRELISLYKLMLHDLNGMLDLMANRSVEGKIKTHFARKSSKSSPTSNIDEDAPDSILDPISFTIFQDPVVTPQGITYEKSVLLDYLGKNRNRDPITKKTLLKENLAPNLAVKAIVSDFLASREPSPV